MSDNKPARLTSLLQSRTRRVKARQRTAKKQLGAESLEDRLVLAAAIDFDPTPAAPLSGDEIQFSSLDFLPGNALIEDYATISADPAATSNFYYQASLGDFLDDMGASIPSGLTTAYEVTAVLEAEVSINASGDLVSSGPGLMKLFFDKPTDANALAGTGYTDTSAASGLPIMTMAFSASDLTSAISPVSGNRVLLDGFDPDNFGGVTTRVWTGGITINGDVTTVDGTYFPSTSVADFDRFNFNTNINTPFQQTNPSKQFEPASGGAAVIPSTAVGVNNSVEDLHLQADASVSFVLNGDIIVQKFLDNNGDGDSTGDAPMAGVTFTVSGTSLSGDPVGPVNGVTGANGRYAFENLPPGTYTVTEVVPAGFVSTTGAVKDVVMVAGQEIVTVNFGNAVPGSIHGFKCEDLDVDGMCGPRLGVDPHVVFVLDYSGSTEDDSGEDLDGDGINESVLDVEKAAVAEAIQFMADFGINAEIGVVAFDGGTSTAALDMDPTAGTLSFTSPTADLDGNGIPDVLDALNTVSPAGLTNYQVALETATALLEPWHAPPANSHVVFISDGVPTEGQTLGNLADEVAALAALSDNIRAFGIASADLTHLQAIDPGAMVFTSPADLASVFSSVVAGVDPPLPGIEFHVYDSDGNLDGTGTTNADGEFWINDLLPDTYTVCEVANSEYVSTTHSHVTLTTASGDVDCLATQTLTITSGQEYAYREGAAHLGAVVGQHVFYNDSAWDGDGTTLSAADDDAIAPDKTAFDGTGTATFANYTSYFNGINGVMVDIEHGIGTGATLADFEFRWSPTPSSNDATTWPFAPAPTMAVRAGDGDGGSDRYSFSWANKTLKNGWLQVVVKANANTGIQMDNIHYWGNAVGETGNMVGDTMVNAADISGVVNHPANVITGMATIDNDYDMNRDKMVNAADISVVVNNPANGLTVPQLTLLHDPTQQGMGSWKKEIVVGNDLIFGNTIPGSIHGFKYVDVDADGVYDPAIDSPWEGIEFVLTGTDKLGNDVHRSTLTDADGEFWFESVVPGTYTVSEVLPAETVASTQTSTTGDILSGQEFVWRQGAAHLPVGTPFEVWYDDDFSSGWTVNGDAFVFGGGIHLADNDVNSSGSAILNEKLSINAFSAAFTFEIDGQNGTVDAAGDPGADGIAFLLQPTGTTELGGAGFEIGYGGLSPSVVVEFDTWMNAASNGFPGTADPTSNHIGININGSTMSIATVGVAPEFDNGDVWYAWVDYDGTTLDVFVDLTPTKPAAPALSAAVDIAGVLGSTTAYPGFTAATGGAFGDHDLLSFHWESPGQGDSLREEIVVGPALMFGNYVPGSIHGFKCEDLNLDGLCEPRVIGDDPHIVFTVDYSASTLDDSGVDLDGDGTNESVLEVEIASVTHFVEWLASQSINAEIGVVAFHGAFPASNADAVQLDMDPTAGSLAFTTPTADLDGNGIIDVVDALNAEAAGGLTNYQAALNVTTDLLAQWDGQANLPEDGYVIFISDGIPTVGDSGDNLADEVAALSAYADHIRAFGINTATLDELQPIDPNAEFFSDPTDLMNIFMFLAPMAGEPPMADVPFELVDANGDVVATELTNDQGEFWFTGLKPGHYTVREGDLAAAFPDDNVMATPGAPSEVEIWVGSHEEHVWREGAAMIPDGSLRQELPPNENLIFTNFVKGSIHGFKYHDVRPDGEPYDPMNDPAFPGIAFDLFDAAGNLVGTEVTNEQGEFWFDDLVPGEYHVVEVTHPSGQVKPSTHTEAWVTVGSGQEIVWKTGAAHLPHDSLREEIVQPWDLSFGNYVLASVHGFKFEDNDADGEYDPNIDAPWAGFEFLLESDHDGDGLYGADDPDGEFSQTQISNENGEFWFINLEPCQYRLSEINLPAGVIQSPEKFLEIFLDSGEEIVWQPGAAMLEPEFLDVPALVPGLNSHWVEVEGPPFDGPNVPHTIDGALAVLALGPGDAGFVAEADAMISAIDFADAEYPEAKTAPFDHLPFGGDDPVFAVEYSGFIDIPADGDYVFSLVHDDGFRLTIGGSVIASFDGDTAPVTTEATVTLTAGTHSFELVSWEQGGRFINELAWKKPGDADFSIPNDVFLKDGTVQVPNPLFLDPSIKKEFFSDPDHNGVWDELTFGNYMNGSIHGFKFEDHDVDGVYDPTKGDEPLGGILFELVQDGVVIDTEGSNILGEFWFTELTPGTYTVREHLDHLGIAATTPTEWTVTIGSREEYVWRPGAAMLAPDTLKIEVLADGNNDPSDDDGFGEKLMFGNAIMGSIHGFKFEDYDGDGIYEPDADTDAGTVDDDGRDQNDKPWANFPFEIIGDLDGDGHVDSITTVTDENGEFWLHAFPGEYTIREKLEDVHEDVVPTTYPSGEATFFVGRGEELVWRPGAAKNIGRLQTEVETPGLAFGNAYRGSMHGCVYNDVNGNGIVDPGDMVQGGVELEITNSAGEVVDTMFTWIDGLYWFEGLYPDTYTVTAVNLPAGVNLIVDVTEFVGSREELVHGDGAAHLGPADPQHEVNLGSRLFVMVQRPNAAPAMLDAEFVDVVESDLVDDAAQNSSESRAQLLDASLASYADERDNRSSDDVADDDENDDLFALLAADHWFIS